MKIEPNELRIDTYRQPGAGSWCVAPDNGVKVTHIPTGLSAQSHEHRSQHRNRAEALNALQAKLDALPRPRIFWTYYPKSRRGYWRVSHMPKPYHHNRAAWEAAHSYVNQLNAKIGKEGETEMAITITREVLDEVRALRLWHWREALMARKQAQNAQDRSDALKADTTYSAQMQGMADLKNADANRHIRAVQTLNSFFDVGDTAEGDDKPLPVISSTEAVSPSPSIPRNFIGQKQE